MDMDSTLITIECIDEIADLQGIKPEVAAITASAMRGEIDFRESLDAARRAARGLARSGARFASTTSGLRLSPGAERMIARLQGGRREDCCSSPAASRSSPTVCARGSPSTKPLANTLEIADGKLTGRVVAPIVDAQAKARAVRGAARALRGDDGITVAIGDGANDLPMLRAADVSIAYRAKPLVRAEATYAIDYCGLDAVLNLFA